jgi:hypothetical protein
LQKRKGDISLEEAKARLNDSVEESNGQEWPNN